MPEPQPLTEAQAEQPSSEGHAPYARPAQVLSLSAGKRRRETKRPRANDFAAGEADDGDDVVIDRVTFLSLVAILESAAPQVELQLQAWPRIRAILVERGAPARESERRDSEAIATAKEIYRARRRRDQVLGHDLFGEPAWDILLDLFVAQQRGWRTPLSSVCVASAVPTTTAQRWIRELEARNLVRRTRDPNDGRRVYVALTETARADLEQLLTEIRPTRA